MKILFTADYHIKLGQKNVPVQWAINRFKSLFQQIRDIDADVHIIGGDIFDRVPTVDEISLYFEFIAAINKPTIIFDGNHEATKKGKTFLNVLKNATKGLNSFVNIITDVHEEHWGTIVPYCKIHQKNIFEGLATDKPLFTHVRGDIPPHVKAEIDLDLLEPFPTVYAGDLHSHSNSQRNIVYPGSPLTTSFHRELVKTGYILIEDGVPTWKEFELPQLIRKTVTKPVEMQPTKYHHTIYELEGDLADLAGIKNTELLDKKVIKRSTEATLILTNSMNIEDELAEYLRYILELPEDKVVKLIGRFRDYSTNTKME